MNGLAVGGGPDTQPPGVVEEEGAGLGAGATLFPPLPRRGLPRPLPAAPPAPLRTSLIKPLIYPCKISRVFRVPRLSSSRSCASLRRENTAGFNMSVLACRTIGGAESRGNNGSVAGRRASGCEGGTGPMTRGRCTSGGRLEIAEVAGEVSRVEGGAGVGAGAGAGGAGAAVAAGMAGGGRGNGGGGGESEDGPGSDLTTGSLAARGTVVIGGGSAPPFRSRTLRFNAGSSTEEPFFSFFTFGTGVAAAFASCSSNACSKLSSTDQKKPFPRSPAQRSIFLNARPDDRLWRTEF